MWSVIVHGGAGSIPGALEEPHRAGCARAVARAAELLGRGAPALDAVCAAVEVLEDDPVYNAGTGGALDQRGMLALDASVMRGEDLAYGAVGAVVGVKNPVRLARAVLEDGRHCLLVGPAALPFARRAGIPLTDPEAMITERARAEWVRRRAEIAPVPATADWAPLPDPDLPSPGNTVGCAARDRHGHVAAATSTGGLLMRYPGRVGDSPIAGAGTYARDDLGAASATGHGETMLRTCFSFQVLLDLRADPGRGGDPAAVLQGALEDATRRAGGRGGVIAVLPDGRVAFARNTPAMGVAWQVEGEPAGTAF